MHRIRYWSKGLLIAITALPLLLATPLPNFSLPATDDDSDAHASSEIGAPLHSRRSLDETEQSDWRPLVTSPSFAFPLVPLLWSSLPLLLVTLRFQKRLFASIRGPPPALAFA